MVQRQSASTQPLALEQYGRVLSVMMKAEEIPERRNQAGTLLLEAAYEDRIPFGHVHNCLVLLMESLPSLGEGAGREMLKRIQVLNERPEEEPYGLGLMMQVHRNVPSLRPEVEDLTSSMLLPIFKLAWDSILLELLSWGEVIRGEACKVLIARYPHLEAMRTVFS
jgi:hypothetical protein